MTRRRSYLLRVRWLCPIQIWKWWLCFPGPPTGSGSCGILHRVLNPQGWTIGFSGWHELVLSHPPRFLSSQRCMKSSLVRGRHLLLPETAPVGPPPSPPLMAVRLRVTRASPLWSGPWLCSCALTPPGAGSRLSLPGPVSTRRTLPAGLTRPVGKPPPPYTLWRCCRSIRPRHWETCTRVVMTHKFITNFVLRRTSRFGRRRLRRGQWAVRCPLWWSRNAISGCVWPTWGIPTKSGSLIPPCPRPASLATRSRTSPSSSRLYRSSLRRLATSCPGGPLLHPLCRRQHLSLLVAEGDPLRLPPLPHRSNSLHPSGAVEPVVGGVPSPSRPPPRGAAKPRARGPRTGDPEMIGTALQEMVTAPLLPLEEGRVVNPLFFPSVPPLAQQPAVPKFSIKEQFLSSPGPKRARRVVGGAKPLHSHPPLLSPADSSAQFEMGAQASPAPPVRPWNQVSVAQHTQTPLRAASQREPPELRPCVPPRCPTAGTPVVPLVPLVRSLRAWLALPSPSRWLIRTIRLGYAIQFARRPPRFRGVHFTSVKAVDTHVLRAEIAVLLAKDAIELVPPADMRSGFYSPTSLYPRKVVGYDRSWICEFWIGALTSYRSRCSRRNAFSSTSVPEIGLQRSTWRTRTFMSRFFLDTGRFCALRSRVEHISTRSYPSGWPCLPASSRKSWREPLFPWENRASASSTISTTGSFSLSLGNSYANTGIWCSVTSASWAFRSTRKRANSPQCRGSLFSVWCWIRSNSQHASQRNVLSRCWTAWIHSGAGQRSHWNFFRGSWGIWRPQRQ